MMMPTGLAELDLRDRRVAEDRPLRDEPAALDAHAGDLHRDAGAEPRREAGADLEAEQAAAEQRVAVRRARSNSAAIASTTGCARPSGPSTRWTRAAP